MVNGHMHYYGDRRSDPGILSVVATVTPRAPRALPRLFTA
jgi:hypothetical protein